MCRAIHNYTHHVLPEAIPHRAIESSFGTKTIRVSRVDVATPAILKMKHDYFVAATQNRATWAPRAFVNCNRADASSSLVCHLCNPSSLTSAFTLQQRFVLIMFSFSRSKKSERAMEQPMYPDTEQVPPEVAAASDDSSEPKRGHFSSLL